MTSPAIYYLVIRPLSYIPSRVESYIQPLSDLTGLDLFIIKNKFVGTSLKVLMVDNDPSFLEEAAARLKREDFPAAVIGKDEVRAIKKPLHAVSLEMESASLSFLSRDSEPLLTVDGNEDVLIVLSTRDISGITRSRMARSVLNGEEMPPGDKLDYILRHHPLMDIYTPDSHLPVRVDSLRFNFNSLGDKKGASTVHNFSAIVREIRRNSSNVLLDIGLGESSLPFLSLSGSISEDGLLRGFTTYSSFVFLAYKKGLFMTGEKGEKLCSPSLNSKDLGCIPLTGHLFSGGVPSVEPETLTAGNRNTSTLPPSPAGITVYRPFLFFSGDYGVKQIFNACRRYMQILSPPILFYPLAITFAGSFVLAYTRGMITESLSKTR